jgi:hypothetical protein
MRRRTPRYVFRRVRRRWRNPRPAIVLPSSSSVAGSGTAAGGSWLETTKNCSRAPLSLKKFTVKITVLGPGEPAQIHRLEQGVRKTVARAGQVRRARVLERVAAPDVDREAIQAVRRLPLSLADVDADEERVDPPSRVRIWSMV